MGWRVMAFGLFIWSRGGICWIDFIVGYVTRWRCRWGRSTCNTLFTSPKIWDRNVSNTLVWKRTLLRKLDFTVKPQPHLFLDLPFEAAPWWWWWWWWWWCSLDPPDVPPSECRCLSWLPELPGPGWLVGAAISDDLGSRVGGWLLVPEGCKHNFFYLN